MKYKITKKDNKYYIRNTVSNKLVYKEFETYDEARQALPWSDELFHLENILNEEMDAKLFPLLKVTQETHSPLDSFYYYGHLKTKRKIRIDKKQN